MTSTKQQSTMNQNLTHHLPLNPYGWCHQQGHMDLKMSLCLYTNHTSVQLINFWKIGSIRNMECDSNKRKRKYNTFRHFDRLKTSSQDQNTKCHKFSYILLGNISQNSTVAWRTSCKRTFSVYSSCLYTN